MADRRSWARRLAMPLVILAVAGGLALWGAHRRTEQADEVHRFVLDLCADLAAGRDPAPHLRSTDSLIRNQLVSKLRSVTQRAGGRAGALTVVAEPGDTPREGTVGQEATHTALVLVDGREAIGLRLVYAGDGGDIAIIGFWVPLPP